MKRKGSYTELCQKIKWKKKQGQNTIRQFIPGQTSPKWYKYVDHKFNLKGSLTNLNIDCYTITSGDENDLTENNTIFYLGLFLSKWLYDIWRRYLVTLLVTLWTGFYINMNTSLVCSLLNKRPVEGDSAKESWCCEKYKRDAIGVCFKKGEKKDERKE